MAKKGSTRKAGTGAAPQGRRPAAYDDAHALQAYFESAGFVRGIVELAGDEVRIVSANADAAHLVRHSRETIAGLSASDLPFSPEEIGLFRQHCVNAASTGEPVIFDYAERRDGASGRRFRIWLTALASDDHPRFAVVGMDVTERAQKQRALQSAERTLRAFFESPGTMRGVAELVNGELRLIVVNEASGTFLGRPTTEINGRFVREVGLQPRTAALWLEKCQEADRTGLPVVFMHHLQRPGMPAHYLRSVVTPAGQGQDGPRFAYSAEDTTAIAEAEDALRRSEESYAALVRNLSGAVYRCRNDANWTVDFISDGCLAITGYQPEELVGSRVTSLGSLIHPDDAPGVSERCQASLAARTACSNEYRITHRDGSTRWVWDRAQGIVGSDGALSHIEGLLIDITDRRREMEEYQALREQLFHAQRVDSIGRLAGGVAHDFNNLLAVVLGHADLLGQRIGPDDPLAEHVTEIRAAGERSMHLTRQLLGFARRQPITPRVIDLNNAVSGSLNLLRRLLGEGVSVQWKPGRATWPVRIDPTQVDQVLTNLCVNSRDAMGGSGVVTIATRNMTIDEAFVTAHQGATAGDYAEILVEDHGEGMDEKTLAHIFDPFFTTKAPGLGTGLGLATVYGIVKQNGGYVDVQSTAGVGTTVRVMLPRDHEHPDRENDGPAASTTPRGNETILLVEDEPALLRLAQRVLTRLGYTVLTAASPREAMDTAMMNIAAVHLLVTDVVMPQMNGRDLANLLQLQNPRLPVLFMSGYADMAFSGNVVSPGVHFIEKPFTAEQLAAKVRTALDSVARIATPTTSR